jgi:polysaccharide pyruvyl transferase WcaK-like protein
VRLVTGTYDCHEIKGVIGQCEFFIGSRMHACIAALSQAIPAVGIAYSRKFAGVFETVGALDYVVDGRTTTNEEAIARILDLFRRRQELRPRLAESVRDARATLQSHFRTLLQHAAAKSPNPSGFQRPTLSARTPAPATEV